MVLLFVGGGGFTRREGLRRVKERLEKAPGASNARYEPSRLRPRTVVVDVGVEMFLGEPFPRAAATLEVLWRPRAERDVQRVQWVDDEVSLGWHKDDDHPDLGTTYFQCERDGETAYEEGGIEVEAPVGFLEVCLERLPRAPSVNPSLSPRAVLARS